MVQIYKLPDTPKVAATLLGEIDELLATELFHALSDPTRSKLLSCLAKCARPCSVGEVAECCSVDLSVVSRHLAILASAGILESNKDGRTVYYAVRYESLITLLRELAQSLEDCSNGKSKLVSIKKDKK